ncbi:2-C-methyl-D-erythritol 4-phosphate cytidylyltransferase [Shewanella dokdonensis]|nr:2-C-methyl-D-erythritol 4-phosphate cytidylyltransferase [Shewanella dokdonensis]MCL1073524.1 2-C-methyl-D-erythritol 4-phosphate cytidylyltransferase [Shewanella dokdonensis]
MNQSELPVERMPYASKSVVAIVPAAGIGSRMGADCPKQYLPLLDGCILGYTLQLLLDHPAISQVVVALHPQDQYFNQLPQANHPKIVTVVGGLQRADSVLAALNTLSQADAWALVHDAARPCLTHADIDKLLAARQQFPQGAILAAPVRDTMKRAAADGCISETVSREALWHALTPQLFPVQRLRHNLSQAIAAGVPVTDEASAMEWAGVHPGLVAGRSDNIKVTHPEDLPLAALFLQYQQQ